jgi:hypothetical protein
MASLNGFNAHEVDPATSFEPLPPSTYVCILTASEMKPTKDGRGEYLELELEIVEGPHQGRKLWDRLNLKNPSETAVRIARGTLSSICRAVGVMAPRDSVELHNLPLVATVGLKKRSDTGEMSNVVKGYAKRESAVAPRPSVAAGGTPPWKR